MKRIITLALALLCIAGLWGCHRNATVATAVIEAVPADYGKAVELAKEELQIPNFSGRART